VVRLALDTSTATVSVAVLGDADTVLAEHSTNAAQGHGEVLMPLIDAALRAADVQRDDLSTVVVGVGPGPFTGLRVGLMTARTIGHALGIDVVGVCSLDAIALQARDCGIAGGFAALTDARRRELYWATYDRDSLLTGPGVAAPVDLANDLRAGGIESVVGIGAGLYPDALAGFIVGPAFTPRAADLARAARDPRAQRPPVPLYLRRPDAALPGPRKSVQQ
jgi:tRNA threonylcarbamoyl adenosine modification protein YeaZ